MCAPELFFCGKMLLDIEHLKKEKTLTARQLEVLELFSFGYDRKEVGRALTPPVCVQAVHQIVLRIRKRLKAKTGLSVKGSNRPSEYVFA